VSKAERKYDIGFFSSCDRGLQNVIDLLPEIEEKLGRKAKVCWAYGFQSFDMVHKKNPDMMKYKWQLIRGINDTGIENKDRLSHEDLAKLMKDTKVWFYPTEFTEIHCITALKAQEAGCIPVTTGCYALKETVINDKYTVECTDINSNVQKRKEIVDAVVNAINDTDYEVSKVSNVDWSDVAKAWSEAIA